MDKEDVIRKIKKLQAMQRATPPEAKRAKELIEKLINKYKINIDKDLPVKKRIKYKLHRLKRYGIHLCKWAKIKHYVISGEPDYIVIYADSDEYKMFHELIDEIKHYFNKKEREFKKESIQRVKQAIRNGMSEELTEKEKDLYIESLLQDSMMKKQMLKWKNSALYSFMKGYMERNYPYDVYLCTMCWEGKIIRNGKDWKCNKCNTEYKNSNMKNKGIVNDAYHEGINTTTRSLKQERILLNG